MKCCIMEKKVTLSNGKTKCRCGYDGSIRNQCNTNRCPHFQPTWFWKIMVRFLRRR